MSRRDVGLELRYQIDRDDRLAEVNTTWVEFAKANEGQALLPPGILGRPLWDFLADATTVHLYREMIQRVRRGGPPIRFQFRCDAPDHRRLLAMDISGDHDGAVRFRVSTVVDQVRNAVSLLEPTHPRQPQLLKMCGWCNRVEVPSTAWVEAEAAVQELGLFGADPMPMLTHGMCPACYAAMSDMLNDTDPGDSGTVTVGPLPAI